MFESIRHNNDGYPIDFVIPWVDGSDPEWVEERNRFLADGGDASVERFRDWNLLRYWFRGVEEFTPWVNKVCFITWGHLPEWLNTNHPKLKVVRHDDYIPPKYLPTFSSHTIELNMYRIEGLSEHFVYFNDDTFLLAPVDRSYFFRNGLPCGTAVAQPYYTSKQVLFYEPVTNVAVLNEHFRARKCIFSHPSKWFNHRVGAMQLRTALMLPYPNFYGFHSYHMPNSFLKSTFEKVWESEGDLLDNTCSHKFRVSTDVNQWLMAWWQFAEGNFYPRSPKSGKLFNLQIGAEEQLVEIARFMARVDSRMICINDGELDEIEYELANDIIHDLFESLLPRKSAFEVF